MRVTTSAGTRCPEGAGESPGEREARMPQTACSLHTQSDTPPPSLRPLAPGAVLGAPLTCRHASPLPFPLSSLLEVQLLIPAQDAQ